MESGLQLHLPTYRNLSLDQLLKLGQRAHAGGVQQLWVTDNLQSRNAFVVLAALAGVVPVRLGTAVLVQYFRSPLDVADAAAAISELMDGRELTLGISRGNPNTHLLVDSPKPVTMLRETAQALHQLLAGERVQFSAYPSLAAYFNIVPQRTYQLNFAPPSPIPLYCGGNAPLSLAVGGSSMDGIVFGWTFLAAARSGRLSGLLEIAETAAREAGRAVPLPRVAEIKIYVDQSDAAARAYCRQAVAGRMVGLFERGYTGDEYARLGIATADIQRLFEAGLRRRKRTRPLRADHRLDDRRPLRRRRPHALPRTPGRSVAACTRARLSPAHVLRIRLRCRSEYAAGVRSDHSYGLRVQNVRSHTVR